MLAVPQPLGGEGTVVITGGTGALGQLLARHLVAEQNVRHLLLVSRSGASADGAAELAAELSEHGCEVRFAACDVADRDALAGVLEEAGRQHPLSAVLHAAGALDDATIASLTSDRFDRVLRAKVDAALHLDELAGEAELVLFSSAAATLGSPGQGNYAAANAFLDALAQRRALAGRPVRSLAYGLWAQTTGLTAEVGDADRARMARLGLQALDDAEGLTLFDAAREHRPAALLALSLDLPGLRTQARSGLLAPLLSDLVRIPPRRTTGGSLAQRLAGIPENERTAMVLAVVRDTVAEVLGYPSSTAVDPEKVFKDAGFDSLSAVELRNRLAQVTGLRLPATL
ncbi:beta-ketoacyl reductase, partial [Mycolicibacter kumamotonensis]|uniref:type I polyketide synthase n=1 Tax=Mycolicibacter kumamotonensis TaxID=354243 RepID=UPI00307835BB